VKVVMQMEENYLNTMFMSGKDKDTFSYSSFFVRLADRHHLSL